MSGRYQVGSVGDGDFKESGLRAIRISTDNSASLPRSQPYSLSHEQVGPASSTRMDDTTLKTAERSRVHRRTDLARTVEQGERSRVHRRDDLARTVEKGKRIGEHRRSDLDAMHSTDYIQTAYLCAWS